MKGDERETDGCGGGAFLHISISILSRSICGVQLFLVIKTRNILTC